MSKRKRSTFGESTDENRLDASLLRHTPFSRKALSLHAVRKSARNKNSLASLSVLTKCNWSAYSVSPLFTWSNREAKLKRYSRRMSELLAQALLTEKAESFDVKYELLPSLVLNTNDEPAVRVSVNLDSDVREKRRVFIAYLLCWGVSGTAKRDELAGVPFLPVMLCAGSRRVEKQFCRGLESIHDCVVAPVHLHEVDRKELGLALLSFLDGKTETVTISYMLRERPECGFIDLEISSALTTKLSSLIHERCGRECSFEDVSLFWDEISDQVYDIFSIKVKYCELVKLKLPHAVITANKFKAQNVNSMHVMLLFLTSKLTLIDSVFPDLGKQ